MSAANPLHWIAALLFISFVVLPSALVLLGIYWHAIGAAEEIEAESAPTISPNTKTSHEQDH